MLCLGTKKFSHSSHSRSSSSQFASFGGKEDTPYAWCAHPDLAASEHHAKGKPSSTNRGFISRILAAICVIVNHAYEELEYGHLSKLQSLSTVSGGAGGGDFRPDATPASTVLQMMLDLDFNDVILPPATKLVQTTMLTRIHEELADVTAWAIDKLGEIDAVYQRGIKIMRKMGILKSDAISKAAGTVSLSAREETFSSSRILLNIFRSEESASDSTSEISDASDLTGMALKTGWASPALSKGAGGHKQTIYNGICIRVQASASAS